MAVSSKPLKWGQEAEMRSQARAPREKKQCQERWMFLLILVSFAHSGICTPILLWWSLLSPSGYSLARLSIQVPTLCEPRGDPRSAISQSQDGMGNHLYRWMNNMTENSPRLLNPAAVSEMTSHHFLPPRPLDLPPGLSFQRPPSATGHLLRHLLSAYDGLCPFQWCVADSP